MRASSYSKAARKAALKIALKASARDIISDLTHPPELRLQAWLFLKSVRPNRGEAIGEAACNRPPPTGVEADGNRNS